MHYLLQGIRGHADRDRNRSITLDELVKYAGRETKLHVERKYNDSQRPKVKGNYAADELEFALVTSRAATQPADTRPLAAKLERLRVRSHHPSRVTRWQIVAETNRVLPA